MKKKSLYIILPILLGITHLASAQDQSDLIKMSTYSNLGTARAMSLGGACGSIGGDFTGINLNPATLGIYRTSSFGFTLALNPYSSNSNYIGNSQYDSHTRFGINQIGYIHSNAIKDISKKKNSTSTSWYLGVSKLADFNNVYTYKGVNPNNSLTDALASDYNTGAHYLDDLTTLAYNAYLLDIDFNKKVATTYVPLPEEQQMIALEKGSSNELNFSLAKNDENKIMYGLGIGVPIGTYSSNTIYSEDDRTGNTNNDFNFFDLTTDIKTNFTGINLKGGLLLQPLPNIRLALYAQSPTYVSLNTSYNYSIDYDVEYLNGTPSVNTVKSEDYVYSYNAIIPTKVGFSGTYLFGTKGLITADYEYNPVKSAQIKFPSSERAQQTMINDAMRAYSKPQNTFRLGAELRHKKYYGRIGYNFSSSPYTQELNSTGTKRNAVSLGLGIKNAYNYIDIAFVHQNSIYQTRPYQGGTIFSDVANINQKLNSLVLTFGFK